MKTGRKKILFLMFIWFFCFLSLKALSGCGGGGGGPSSNNTNNSGGGAPTAGIVQTGLNQLSTGDMAGAYQSFNTVVASDPQNQVGNLGLAITRIGAVLTDLSPGTDPSKLQTMGQILDRFGFSQAGRDFTNFTSSPPVLSKTVTVPGPYSYSYTITCNVFPASSPTPNELKGYLANQVLPQIQAALTNLQAINPDFSFTLTTSFMGNARFTGRTLDYSDVLAFKTVLHGVEAVIAFLNSYDIDVNLAEILNQNCNQIDPLTYPKISAQAFLTKYPNFMKLVNVSAIHDFKAYTILAMDDVITVLDSIHNETHPQTNDLITINPATYVTDRQLLVKIKDTFTGAQVFNQGMANQFTLNSGPFLSGLDLRNYFPSFVDSQAVYASFSAPTFDPTLNGVFPAATAKDWIKFFDGTSPHVLFTAPCPSGSTTGCAANSLSGVVWSGSQFVAIGGNGTIVTSPDGINWTPRTSGYNSLSGVTWSGSQFVAVGGWTILTSPDGITWTTRTTGTVNYLAGVTWSGSQFVAVGYGGTILTSPDGIVWTSRTTGTTNSLYGVTWSGSQFVAVGYGGAILTSPDGIVWTSRTTGTMNSLYGVTWSGSQFVAVGSWWGMYGSGTVITSPDGVVWTSRTPCTVYCDLMGVVWSGSQFVAVGGSGIILTSPDGINWTSRTSGTTNGLTAVTWSGSQFVAVGGGTIVTSPDGMTWTSRNPGTMSNPVSVQIQVDDKETLANGTTQMGSGFDPSSLYLTFYSYTSNGNGSVTGKDINLNPLTITSGGNIAPLFTVSGPDINGIYTITPNGGTLTFNKGTSTSMNVNLYLSLSDFARRSSWAYTSFTVQ